MPERLESEAIARMLDDLSRADLGDPRRVARAQSVVERLATNPNAWLPAAMVTDAELEGAYRLFGNDSVSFERVFDSHALTVLSAKQCAELGMGMFLAVGQGSEQESKF